MCIDEYAEKTLLMSVLPEMLFLCSVSRLLGELPRLPGLWLHAPDIPTVIQSGKPEKFAVFPHTAHRSPLSQPSSSPWLWDSCECLLVPLLRHVCVHILLVDNWLCVWWNRGSAKGKWRKAMFENKHIKQNSFKWKFAGWKPTTF